MMRARGEPSRRSTEPLTALGQYLAEIKGTARLYEDEERRLAVRAAAGDRDAVASLVEHHLPLAAGIARRYAGHGVPLEDLIQEGNLGLIHAAEKFDPARGVRFAVYATWWVRQRISRALFAMAHIIRVPRPIRMDMQRLATTSIVLERRRHRRPAETELAAAMGRSPERIRFLRSVPDEPVSLDHQLNGGRDAVPAPPMLPDPGAAGRSDIALAIQDLPPRLAQIVRLRFGLQGGRHLTLREVGSILHISRERVRQLEHRALKRLRERRVA